jgi:leucyl-tRNA synthetase
MYEMFLGPVEQSKPWDTKGIEGVHRFIKKFWRLFYDEINKTEFHKMSFDSLDQSQLDLISENVQSIIDEILSSYENDYIIEPEDITSQPVIIKKKSFISSLVETDNNDVYI